MSTTQGQPPSTAEQVDVVWSWVVWTSRRPRSAPAADPCSRPERINVYIASIILGLGAHTEISFHHNTADGHRAHVLLS